MKKHKKGVFKTDHDWEVTQHFATSLDGTKIPYFEVSKTAPGDARQKSSRTKRRTLLYAYGGFEISLTPSYSTVTGIG